MAKDGVTLPAPDTASHTIHVHYLKTFVDLEKAEEEFDGVNGWEDWALYGVAIDLLTKEESLEQAAALASQRAVLEAEITALAGNRDAGEPATVQDTRRDARGSYGELDDRGIWYR